MNIAIKVQLHLVTITKYLCVSVRLSGNGHSASVGIDVKCTGHDYVWRRLSFVLLTSVILFTASI